MTGALPRESEIDGLRSLAILPVVLYHAGWSFVPGGFVGVDIFFVISGYLITSLLDRDIAAGEFSLLRFYERRARRIMPALIVVLTAATIVAVLILLPNDLVLFSRSLQYTALFASNVYFFQQTGYFDAAADSYALLHTWSLAIEEQFYLLFPLILLACAKLLGRRRIWAIALLAAASLAASIVLSQGYPEFSFYLPFTRAWELLAGSLLALSAISAPSMRPVREVVAALSFAAILLAVVLIHQNDDFPGSLALIPVLGTLGLIRFSPETLVGRLLTLPPVVGLGLISYSVYLWHWPLLTFASYWLIRPLTPWEGTAVVAASVVLAAITWKLVEQPFRNRALANQRTVFVLAATGIAILVGFGVWTIQGRGFETRVPGDVLQLAAAASDFSPKRKACHDLPLDTPLEGVCALGADASPTVAVWGDSHGVELAYAVGEMAARTRQSVQELTSSSCPPGLNFHSIYRVNCEERNRRVLNYLLSHPHIRTVIMTAYRHLDGRAYLDALFPGMEQAIAALRSGGRTVVIVYPVPDEPTRIPTRLAREKWHTGHMRTSVESLGHFNESLKNTLARLDALVSQYDLVAIQPTNVYCPDGTCLAYRNGKVLYFDRYHPSLAGARMVAPLFANVLRLTAQPR